MPAIWPSSLPQYVLQEGYSEKLNNQTIESQVDSGPVKVRRRYTKQIRTFEVSILLTQSQFADFETFWQTTLAGGSLTFDWVHPLTRATLTFRFRNPAPSYVNVAGQYVRASFKLETT